MDPPHASNSSTASTEEREEEESKIYSPLKIWDTSDENNYKTQSVIDILSE